MTVWQWVRRLAGWGDQTARGRLGRRGEKHAAKLLRRAGYRVLGRNVRVQVGEADIVCVDPDGATIVIVEVKTRWPGAAGSEQGAAIAPEASIHAHKRRTLLAVARSLATSNGWHGRPIRIDVIAVEWQGERGTPVVRHHVDAVSG